MKAKDVRALSDTEIAEKIKELERELAAQQSTASAGGKAANPGKIRTIRKTIARLLTIMHERKIGIRK